MSRFDEYADEINGEKIQAVACGLYSMREVERPLWPNVSDAVRAEFHRIAEEALIATFKAEVAA